MLDTEELPGLEQSKGAKHIVIDTRYLEKKRTQIYYLSSWLYNRK